MEKKTFEFTLPVGTILTGDVMPNGNGEHYQYHVESVLGQGGFGITYKVWCIVKNGQIRTRTFFAIKEHFVKGRCHRAKDGVTVEYSQEAATDVEDSLKDFVKEGRLLQSICQVGNPKDLRNRGYQNIVPVNEVIEANNTAYFVMEYLDGGCLRDMIQKTGTGMSEEKALSLMVPICQAVSYIHGHGILHMDIKPENIVMRRNLVTMLEEPVLIDFGVSLHFDKKGSLTTKHTSFGRSEGYSPIEQYGEIKKFQPQIDVYALGATLLYFLSGKTPPSAFNITSDYIEKNIPSSVSDRTRKAIIHALAKDSTKRTPSAEAFISELANRYTLPIGYILHGPHVNYLITGISRVHTFFIKYDAVIYTGDNSNTSDANSTQRHQYVIYEYYVKGASTRQDDGSINTVGMPQYQEYLEMMKKRTDLEGIDEAASSDFRIEREIFYRYGSTYAVVDRQFKPANRVIKVADNVTAAVKKQKKKLKNAAICLAVIGGLFFVIPAMIKAFQKTDADWSRELTEAINQKDIERLQQFADMDSVRAILPFAKVLLETGDTINARMYAEKAFTGELKLDTVEARRILVAIQDLVASDLLSKQKAAREDSILQAEKDSLRQANEVTASVAAAAKAAAEAEAAAKKATEEAAKQQELAKKQEELKKQELAKKKEEEKKQKEAAQKVADQAYANKMALQYANGQRTLENYKKAYEWALKADEKTKAQVFKKLRDADFPFP